MPKFYKGISLLSEKELIRFTLVILASIVSAGCSVLSFMLLFEFLNYLKDNQDLGTVLNIIQSNISDPNLELQMSIYSFCVGFLFIFSAFLQVMRSYITNKFSLNLIYSLSKRSLENALGLSYKAFADKSTGMLSALILSETELLVHRYYRPMVNATSSFFFSIILGIFLCILNFKITILIIIILAISYSLILILLRSTLLAGGAKRKIANEERYKLVNEALIGIKTIKIFSLEREVNESFEHLTKNMVKQIVQSVMMAEIPSYVMQGLLFGGTFMVLAIIAQYADIQSIFINNVTTLVVFAGVILRLLPEFQRIYNGLSNATFSMQSIDTLKTFLNSDKDQTINGTPDPSSPFTIKFCNVTVEHDDNCILDNISLEIKDGEVLGIVGKSGSGKTTLLDVLMGLIDPSSGHISVGGTSMSNFNRSDWLRNISYVPQNIFLMNRSLLENVTLTDAESYNKELYDSAIENSLLSEFVESRGDNIEVGEAGAKMSGGQIQRAGIARALYKDAKLLVLDEATSSLDISAEKEILRNIIQKGSATTIIVTHRLDALKYCDKIIIMEKGKILHFGAASALAPLVAQYFDET